MPSYSVDSKKTGPIGIRVGFVFKLMFSIVLVAILLLNVPLSSLLHLVVESNQVYLASGFMILALALAFGVLRWNILLRRFTETHSIRMSVKLSALAHFYNLFLPGGFAGDIFRGFKYRDGKISGAQAMATVAMDRLIGLGGFICFLVFGLFIKWNDLKSLGFLWYLFPMILACIIIIVFICFKGSIKSIKFRTKVNKELYAKLENFHTSLNHYRHDHRLLGKALLVSLITSFLNIAVFYLIGIAFGSSVSFFNYMVLIPIIMILSLLPVSYRGLGIREAAFVVLFTKVGMTKNLALCIPLVYFGQLILLSIGCGILYLIMETSENIIKIIKEEKFNQAIFSLKSTSVIDTIDSNIQFSEKYDYHCISVLQSLDFQNREFARFPVFLNHVPM